MSIDSKGGWIPIAEAVSRIARAEGCTDVEARRRIANRFQDREFRLAADKVVTQLVDAKHATSVMLGERLPVAIPPMERTVDECIQLTALMFPPGAIEPESPIWTGEASFPLPHEGPLARVSYYGIRVQLSAIEANFPSVTLSPPQPGRSVAAKERRKPGPAPDPDWPHAIAKVTQDCLAAGYRHPLKRGDLAAIQTMLLNYMAGRDKHFSDDIAAKHARQVIAALPDK